VRTLAELGDSAKARLAAKRVFFGHQSVGGNIMDGVADIVRQQPSLGLRLVDLDAASREPAGFFAHACIGRNNDPLSKTAEFERLMEQGLAARVGVAFHKYCFVDVTGQVDVAALFAAYKAAMDRLRTSHPKVRFVHVTVPLTWPQSGPKALVKRLFGRAPAGYADNFRREEFNDLMRRQYLGREPLFDLAALEATDIDGRTVSIGFQGRTGRSLFGPYACDGGHLNESGRRHIAENLLVFLAELQ
jgi:hypothetical protein